MSKEEFMNKQQIWTEEIKSNSSVFSVNFKEVWHYRDLLFMLFKRDYLTVYKQTILGPIWFFVQPVMTTLIYVLLFGQIAKLSTGGDPCTFNPFFEMNCISVER